MTKILSMMYRITFLMLLFLPFLAKTNASTVPNWTNKNSSISCHPTVKDTLNPKQTEDVEEIKKTLEKRSRVAFISGCLSAIFTILSYVFLQTAIMTVNGFFLLLLLGAFIAALVAILSGHSFLSIKKQYPNIMFKKYLARAGLILAKLSLVGLAAYVVTILVLIFFFL